MSRSGAIDQYETWLGSFDSTNINGLYGLDQFAMDNTDALIVAAKMSLLHVNTLQQLIMLGSVRGENSTLKDVAGGAATWLNVSDPNPTPASPAAAAGGRQPIDTAKAWHSTMQVMPSPSHTPPPGLWPGAADSSNLC
jgi:hypothetical protein